MRFGNYGEYLKRRWNELGGEAATEAVRQRLGIVKEEQMPWATDEERGHQLAAEFLKAQCPIFVRIVGELHHVLGNRDVGLGKKNGGNRWELPGDDVATDIIVLKDLDGSDAVQLVDCFSSMGGPESKPMWAEIDPNSDRTFVVPPVPGGDDVPVTGDPHDDGVSPVGSVIRIDIAPIVAELLKPLEAENAELRKRIEALETRPSSQPLELPKRIALRDFRGKYVSTDTPREAPYQNPLVANREDRGDWEVFEMEPVE